MSGPGIDPERLAALLDGRLSDAERREVLERLAASEAELEAYADAAAVVGEVEDEDAGGHHGESGAGVVALDTTRRRAVRWRRLALAAMVAGVGVGVAQWMELRLDSEASGAAWVALIPTDVSRSADLYGAPWSVSRGADPITESARTARIGVRLVHLDFAVRAGDGPAIRMLAKELSVLIDRFPGGGPAAEIFRRIADWPGSSDAGSMRLVDDARMAAALVTDASLLHLAAWIETSRIAAMTQTDEYFGSPEYESWIAAVLGTGEMPTAVAESLARAREITTAGIPSSAGQWSALEREFMASIRVLVN